jgi:hypothetical protein
VERVKSLFLLAVLFLAWSIRSSGQLVGSCPPTPLRSPQDVSEIRGVVVDKNIAVIPKIKVKLQVPRSTDFRDVALAETDLTGRFSFEKQPPGQYVLVFTAPAGFCSATIPVNYSKRGFKGIRLTLPVGATDTCPQYCESGLKVEEMTGLEGRMIPHNAQTH